MKLRGWLPNIVTLLLAALLVVTQQAWASPLMARLASPTASSKTTIAYQGYLTDGAGAPVNQALEMVFKLYNVESGGAPLWTETQPSVAVADGVFSVLLGSVTSISANIMASNSDLWLGVTIGSDQEMAPRDKIASAPYAMMADVADSSITTAKLADGGVSQAKISTGAVASDKLADGAVTQSKLAPAAVTTSNLSDSAVTSAKLANNSVVIASIAGGAVTSAKLADGAVTSSKIGTGQVTSVQLANDTITEAQIADGFMARNADKLDGQDSSTFAAAGHNHDTRYVQSSVGGSRRMWYGKVRGCTGSNGNWIIQSVPHNLTSVELGFVTPEWVSPGEAWHIESPHPYYNLPENLIVLPSTDISPNTCHDFYVLLIGT